MAEVDRLDDIRRHCAIRGPKKRSTTPPNKGLIDKKRSRQEKQQGGLLFGITL